MENTQILDVSGRPANYTYLLSLGFVHEDKDLTYIAETLGLTIHRIWKKGDEYVRPNGKKISFFRRKSACSFSLPQENETELSIGLSSAVSLLKPHRAFLHEVVDSGVEAYLSVGWFGQGWNFGERLDWQLMQDVSDLKLSLDMGVYCSDSDDTDIEANDAQRL